LIEEQKERLNQLTEIVLAPAKVSAASTADTQAAIHLTKLLGISRLTLASIYKQFLTMIPTALIRGQVTPQLRPMSIAVGFCLTNGKIRAAVRKILTMKG